MFSPNLSPICCTVADISELAFGLPAGGIRPPPATNEIFCLGFQVKAQLVPDVGGWIGAEKPGIASPERNLLHAGSSGGFSRVAPSTLATAFA